MVITISSLKENPDSNSSEKIAINRLINSIYAEKQIMPKTERDNRVEPNKLKVETSPVSLLESEDSSRDPRIIPINADENPTNENNSPKPFSEIKAFNIGILGSNNVIKKKRANIRKLLFLNIDIAIPI
ncbi:hypothetical protein ACQV5M_18660 [Leptospira sp. SA-E8]|uniref:hypothetical protein n=1 Tax=Leptospira sp. SA-E8 TaxID=3422259 RepID=UPI003EC141D4